MSCQSLTSQVFDQTLLCSPSITTITASRKDGDGHDENDSNDETQH